MKKTISHSLLKIQREHDKKLENIGEKASKEENSVLEKVSHMQAEDAPLSQKIADGIAYFSGSMLFLFLNAVFFFIWIFINTVPFGIEFFDPYPFGFLTMIVSLEAIFLSCFVLISQNRQAEKDRERNEGDYLVNLRAEIEVRSLHQKIDLLLQEQIESQTEQLEMLCAIEDKIAGSKKKKKKK